MNMILLFDIGNTNIVLGLAINKRFIKHLDMLRILN